MRFKTKGGIAEMEVGLLRTSDGSEIRVTEDMLEDFYIVSKAYNVTVKELVENIFGVELETNI
jgi:hypothetical protein